MWLISLLFLPLSSALFEMPYGIQYNSVTEEDLKSGQCSQCYHDDYREHTTSEDILSCAGPVLFVGAQKHVFWVWWYESTISLGAFALASEVHKITALNTPHESNGAYWYFTPGKSFGFLGDGTLQQEPDADMGTTNAESRLSWNLDHSLGGYRAGDMINLNNQRYMRKLIYNCPINLGG